MRAVPGVTGLALALHATTAVATCGICAQDRIAAVYDHGSIVQALDRKHYVAFFAIDGTLAPRARHVIEVLAESTFAVDKGSARVSVKAAALSLAFDPQRVAFAAVQRILDRKLAAIRLSQLPMRIMDELSKLNRVGQVFD